MEAIEHFFPQLTDLIQNLNKALLPRKSEFYVFRTR